MLFAKFGSFFFTFFFIFSSHLCTFLANLQFFLSNLQTFWWIYAVFCHDKRLCASSKNFKILASRLFSSPCLSQILSSTPVLVSGSWYNIPKSVNLSTQELGIPGNFGHTLCWGPQLYSWEFNHQSRTQTNQVTNLIPTIPNFLGVPLKGIGMCFNQFDCHST